MAKPLFPSVPDDVSALSDEDIDRLIGEAEEGLAKVEAGDTDGRSQTELLAEVKQGVDSLDKLRSERDGRAAVAEKDAEELAALIARGRGEAGDDPDPDADDPDAAADPEPTAEAVEAAEAVLASARESGREFARAKGTTGDRLVEAARKRNALRVGRASAEHQPLAERAPMTVVASSDIPGYPNGQTLDGDLDVARAMMKKFDLLGASTVEVKAPVAHMRWEYPDERRLDGAMSDSVLTRRIRKVVGDAPKGRATLEAITASGGLCAPVEIRYDLPVLAQADRPVRDSLANFNATRGGIRFATPPSLAAAGASGVGRVTAAADAGGATKPCRVVACPPFVEVDTAAIYHCIQFGNMGSRAFPELVENAVELTTAAQARIAETALLDGMVAASTHATVALTPSATAALGANAILLPALLRAAAAQRNRQRMDPEAILDVQMPAWTLDLLTSDLVRSSFDRFAANDADLVRTMESYGLRVNFYWDGPTGKSQVYGAQTNNAPLIEFPPNVEFFMYPAGSYLFLDGGTLDIGLVRDSVLNLTNDYQMFAETFENIAFIGLESLWVTAAVCDTGAVAAAVQSVCGS